MGNGLVFQNNIQLADIFSYPVFLLGGVYCTVKHHIAIKKCT